MLIQRLHSRIQPWAERRNHPLLNRISASLERDRNLPASQVFRKTRIYLKSLLAAPFYLRKCDRVGKRVRTQKKPYIENSGRIEIGDDVNINSRNVQTDLVTGPNGIIEIGNEVSINFGVSIVAEEKVSIGDRTRIAPYTFIYDSDRHVPGSRFSWAQGDPVIIEPEVWLATRVIILKGSLIGRGSIIASGSVVSGVIPPYVVAAGAPARVIRHLEPPENEFKMEGWPRSTKEPICAGSTYQRVISVFGRVIPHLNIDSLNLSISPTAVEGWDSITHLQLIDELEKEFRIRFKNRDLARLSNPEKICRVIQVYLDRYANGVRDNTEQDNLPNELNNNLIS